MASTSSSVLPLAPKRKNLFAVGALADVAAAASCAVNATEPAAPGSTSSPLLSSCCSSDVATSQQQKIAGTAADEDVDFLTAGSVLPSPLRALSDKFDRIPLSGRENTAPEETAAVAADAARNTLNQQQQQREATDVATSAIGNALLRRRESAESDELWQGEGEEDEEEMKKKKKEKARACGDQKAPVVEDDRKADVSTWSGFDDNLLLPQSPPPSVATGSSIVIKSSIDNIRDTYDDGCTTYSTSLMSRITQRSLKLQQQQQQNTAGDDSPLALTTTATKSTGAAATVRRYPRTTATEATAARDAGTPFAAAAAEAEEGEGGAECTPDAKATTTTKKQFKSNLCEGLSPESPLALEDKKNKREETNDVKPQQQQQQQHKAPTTPAKSKLPPLPPASSAAANNKQQTPAAAAAAAAATALPSPIPAAATAAAAIAVLAKSFSAYSSFNFCPITISIIESPCGDDAPMQVFSSSSLADSNPALLHALKHESLSTWLVPLLMARNEHDDDDDDVVISNSGDSGSNNGHNNNKNKKCKKKNSVYRALRRGRKPGDFFSVVNKHMSSCYLKRGPFACSEKVFLDWDQKLPPPDESSVSVATAKSQQLLLNPRQRGIHIVVELATAHLNHNFSSLSSESLASTRDKLVQESKAAIVAANALATVPANEFKKSSSSSSSSSSLSAAIPAANTGVQQLSAVKTIQTNLNDIIDKIDALKSESTVDRRALSVLRDVAVSIAQLLSFTIRAPPPRLDTDAFLASLSDQEAFLFMRAISVLPNGSFLSWSEYETQKRTGSISCRGADNNNNSNNGDEKNQNKSGSGVDAAAAEKKKKPDGENEAEVSDGVVALEEAESTTATAATATVAVAAKFVPIQERLRSHIAMFKSDARALQEADWERQKAMNALKFSLDAESAKTRQLEQQLLVLSETLRGAQTTMFAQKAFIDELQQQEKAAKQGYKIMSVAKGCCKFLADLCCAAVKAIFKLVAVVAVMLGAIVGVVAMIMYDSNRSSSWSDMMPAIKTVVVFSLPVCLCVALYVNRR